MRYHREGRENSDGEAWIGIHFDSMLEVGCVQMFQVRGGGKGELRLAPTVRVPWALLRTKQSMTLVTCRFTCVGACRTTWPRHRKSCSRPLRERSTRRWNGTA